MAAAAERALLPRRAGNRNDRKKTTRNEKSQERE